MRIYVAVCLIFGPFSLVKGGFIGNNIFENVDVNSNLVFGEQRMNSLITEIIGTSFLRCIDECKLHTRCRSVNYLQQFSLCQLNSEDTWSDGQNQIQKNAKSVYTQRRSWVGANDRSCGMHNCAMNEKCTRNNVGDFECIISDCADPPFVDSAETDKSRGIGVLSKVTYKCPVCMVSTGRDFVGCLPDGSWTTTQLTCQMPETLRFTTSDYQCYKQQTTCTWYYAKVICNTHGSYLAEVSSEEESRFLECLVDVCSVQKRAWLGGTDESTNKWIWATSLQPISMQSSEEFNKWHTGRPGDKSHHALCIRMDRNNGIWGWEDKRCDRDNADSFICEKDIS